MTGIQIDTVTLLDRLRIRLKRLKMADNTEAAVKMARLLAIAHIVVGFLLLCFGIADAALMWPSLYPAISTICFGIWLCLTGGLGIPGSSRDRTGSSNCFAGIFMGFTITSAVLGGTIIFNYGIMVAGESDQFDYHDNGYEGRMFVHAIILSLGIAQFVIGIWAAICCCVVNPCMCCIPKQAPQAAYTTNPAGYVMSQGSSTLPVAVPPQAGAQESQCPMVLVPVSGAIGGHPPFVQLAPTEASRTTDSSPQQQKHGQYIPLKEQV